MTHIDILKQALEALEESELTWKTDKAITSLEQAIAKAEKQEPVAWLNENESVDCYALSWYKNYTHTTPLYTYPQSKHFESQDWSLLEATQESLREHMARIKELETQLAAQPKREPLTDEQTERAAMKLAECMDYPWAHMPEEGKREMRNHAKAIIEAAYGIKE